MAASTGIRIKKTATEDSTATGTAHTTIPESVRDVFPTRTDDGNGCRRLFRLKQRKRTRVDLCGWRAVCEHIQPPFLMQKMVK